MIELLSVVKIKESSENFAEWGHASGTIVDIQEGAKEPYQIEFCDDRGRALDFISASEGELEVIWSPTQS